MVNNIDYIGYFLFLPVSTDNTNPPILRSNPSLVVGMPVLRATFVFKPLIPTARFSENDNPFMVIKFKFIFPPAKVLLFRDIFTVLFSPFLRTFVYMHNLLYFCSVFEQTSIQYAKSMNDSCPCSVVLGKPVNTDKKRPCYCKDACLFLFLGIYTI